MPFATAISTHPVSSHATGELIGQVLEELGGHPDVALLLATPGHAGALEDVTATVHRLLAPTLLVGATAPALAGQGADERGGPAMGLWAAITGPVQPVGMPGQAPPPGFRPTGVLVFGAGGVDLAGAATDLGSRGAGGVGEAEFARGGSGGGGSGAADAPEGWWGGGSWGGGWWGAASVVGAVSPAGPLFLGDRPVSTGMVGVAFGPGVRFEAVRAAGWRAIGPEMVVTESDPARGLILTLDGIPALERLHRLAKDEVPAEEIARINRRLGIGLASPGEPGRRAPSDPLASSSDPLASSATVDPAELDAAADDDPAASAADPATADAAAAAAEAAADDAPADAAAAAMVAEVRGGDRSNGAIAAGPLAEGCRVRFSVGAEPEADLRQALAGRRADTVLAFVADPATRGYRVDPGGPPLAADAAVIADALGVSRVLGVVTPGQIGPGSRHLGRAEAALALLSDA